MLSCTNIYRRKASCDRYLCGASIPRRQAQREEDVCSASERLPEAHLSDSSQRAAD